ncbi:MAG TPA: DUF4032 domain-containing protein [Myxococcaceae bacterium]|nr:DUF4032 domain-containing protein [Myxococcaceae bacterium]
MAPDGLVGLEILPGNPDFLDLPWHLPMARWREVSKRIVEVPRGISRHEVLFLQYDRTLYAAKELPPEVGEREYDALRWLEQRELPAVHAAGHARVRRGSEETSLLFTRFLEHSIPFRTLFENARLETYRPRLLDAIAGLLVRLHLAGFFWGDCSLSNTLFKRDAGQLQAYLVDAETAEMHDELSTGQRLHDLELLQENVAGDLLDVAAMLGERREEALDRTPAEIRSRYERLWSEVNREEWVSPSESWRIHERIKSLNALGFTVGEVKLEAVGDGNRLRMRAIVTDRDYHRDLLHDLTGLNAEDHQAKLMVQEIQELQATLARAEKRSVPLPVAAYRWLTERYQPTVRRLAGKGDPPELYCELLENKWYLSECAGRDVGMTVALEDYLKRFAADLKPPGP